MWTLKLFYELIYESYFIAITLYNYGINNFITLNWCSDLLGPFDYILASYSKLTKKTLLKKVQLMPETTIKVGV